MIIAGSISGTSIDGIDVAVGEFTGIETGTITLRPIRARTFPWSAALRARLLAALPPGDCTAGELCELDVLCGREIAAAVQASIDGLPADLVVSHGQTIFHWVLPDGHAMGGLQLGQPAAIVEVTGLPVISDVRSRDIAAGGQGAPLAGTLDALLLRGQPEGTGLLNLGGIANVSLLQGSSVLAFDTGPASCLIDLVMQERTGRPYDEDGATAAAGTVDTALLAKLLDTEYFARPAPKSTGRELFDRGFLQRHVDREMPVADLVATLTELTARTVADAVRPLGVGRLLVSGGGVHNATLMTRLGELVGSAGSTREIGLDPDAKEGYLMGLLGYLTWHGVPGVLPGMTGSAVARVLGRISPGDQPLQLPAPARPPQRLIVT